MVADDSGSLESAQIVGEVAKDSRKYPGWEGGGWRRQGEKKKERKKGGGEGVLQGRCPKDTKPKRAHDGGWRQQKVHKEFDQTRT